MPGGTTGDCATVATSRARSPAAQRAAIGVPNEGDRAAARTAGRRRRAAGSTCRRRSGPMTVTHSPAATLRSTPRRIGAPPRLHPQVRPRPRRTAAASLRAHPDPRAVRRTSTKNGRAEERGDHADRDLGRGGRRSARPGRPAPGTPRRTASTAAGSPGSCDPASSRTVCGTMMPTKPISPETETAAAVPSEAAAISRMSRDRCGCRPRLAASSSPTREHVQLAAQQQHHDGGDARRTAGAAARRASRRWRAGRAATSRPRGWCPTLRCSR